MPLTPAQRALFRVGYDPQNQAQFDLITQELAIFKTQFARSRLLTYATGTSFVAGVIANWLPFLPTSTATTLLLVTSGALGLLLYQQTSPALHGSYSESLATMLEIFHRCFPAGNDGPLPDCSSALMQDFILSICPLLDDRTQAPLHRLLEREEEQQASQGFFRLFRGANNNAAFTSQLRRQLHPTPRQRFIEYPILGERGVAERVERLAEVAAPVVVPLFRRAEAQLERALAEGGAPAPP